MITAQYFPQKDQWVIENQDFDQVLMAVIFGDPTKSHLKHHTVVVAGRRVDDTILLLEGFSGYLDDVATEAINLKDRYKVRRCIVPIDKQELVNELRQTEGLVKYQKIRDKTTNREFYTTESNTWQFFAGREILCVLAGISPNLEGDPISAVQRFERMVSKGEILLPRDWKGLNRLLSRPLRETINNSILLASVYVCLSLIKHTSRYQHDSKNTPRYGNLPRR